ncbi:hypothetical protein RhiirA5_436858 [Rhizophagus irregularis]|uniref:ZSWIM1/3 RNaseH-like domain-containing protein n=2 Tax=Rhizophagus irregularis TaxID=588596 RepID=A0A2N0NLC3_9GLOM|nr:hypothetical protein RhiirA5_436858 [Rhizophagus irregularis]
MDKSPKLFFLVVFSSEEEEIADVNSLQKEFEEIANKTSTDSENIVNFDDKVVFGLKVGDAFEEIEGENDLSNVKSTDSESTEVEGESILLSVKSTDSESIEFDDNIAFRLEIGDTFEDWDLAERQIEKHATETGFEILKRRFGRNKHGEIISCTFECKNSRKYHAKKKADIKDNHERESEHNHPLIENIRDMASKFHRLSPEMLEEVEFFVNIGCSAGPIIRGLQKRFPDARIMYTMQYLQRKEHGWFVEARLEGEDNHLTGLFWMRPSQIDLWQRFHDVAIYDNTSQTNKYRMYLSLMIVVDNYTCSQIVANAVISDETKETY